MNHTAIQFVAVPLLFLAIMSCSDNKIKDSSMTANERARTHLQQLLADGEFPGIQYTIIDRRGVVFEFNGGSRDISTNTPVAAETTFMSASSTKVITALAVLQLVDRGLVSLDAPLNRYFRDHTYGNDLTVRQLIVHTAGVPNPLPLDWFHLADQHDQYDENVELGLQIKKNPKLKSSPGATYNYSNLGYWLLYKVIESAAQMPYDDYVRQSILEPLNITSNDLGFTIPSPGNHAVGYIKRFSIMRALMWAMAPGFVMGKSEGAWTGFATLHMNGPSYGGLFGTARGWQAFLMDQLQEKSRVMSPAVKRLFYETQRTAKGAPISMTLGWHTGDLEGHGYFYKAGGGPGYSCNIRTYPKSGMASVWHSNLMQMSESPIQKLSDAIDSHFLR
jgi:D-alanyl-D-alanine carboxypeptidase